VHPGGVTAAMLGAAKNVLRRMDVVIIMEEFSQHWPQLVSVFSWKLNGSSIPAKNRHKEGEGFGDEDKVFLRDLNKFDFELYEFGREIARKRTREARTALGLVDMDSPLSAQSSGIS